MIRGLNGQPLLEVPGDGLVCADLRGADLGWANLFGKDLRGARLCGACLQIADLRGADLRDADLHLASLRGADLRGANLGGAQLHGVDLRDADFCGAKLSWNSGDLLGELLFRAAISHEEFRLAALVSTADRLGWGWYEFLAMAGTEPVEWALGVLADYVVDGDEAPECVRKAAGLECVEIG